VFQQAQSLGLRLGPQAQRCRRFGAPPEREPGQAQRLTAVGTSSISQISQREVQRDMVSCSSTAAASKKAATVSSSTRARSLRVEVDNAEGMLGTSGTGFEWTVQATTTTR
jgi:hypothetical protein